MILFSNNQFIFLSQRSKAILPCLALLTVYWTLIISSWSQYLQESSSQHISSSVFPGFILVSFKIIIFFNFLLEIYCFILLLMDGISNVICQDWKVKNWNPDFRECTSQVAWFLLCLACISLKYLIACPTYFYSTKYLLLLRKHSIFIY